MKKKKNSAVIRRKTPPDYETHHSGRFRNISDPLGIFHLVLGT